MCNESHLVPLSNSISIHLRIKIFASVFETSTSKIAAFDIIKFSYVFKIKHIK